jgi:predicted acyltransferase
MNLIKRRYWLWGGIILAVFAGIMITISLPCEYAGIVNNCGVPFDPMFIPGEILYIISGGFLFYVPLFFIAWPIVSVLFWFAVGAFIGRVLEIVVKRTQHSK